MSDHVNVLLVGAGYMGREYGKVLNSMQVPYSVVCRKEESAKRFREEIGVMPVFGGIDKALEEMESLPPKAIVAVSVNQLSETVIKLLKYGIREVLVEKPAGLYKSDFLRIIELCNTKNACVYVAYNRRFYASTEKAIEIIQQDGGVSSYNFEFTEWGYKIEETSHPVEVKEEWLLANSSHVIDLAFFLGGSPIEMSSYCAGSLDWHSRASKYAGAGMTDKGALFSYQANWDAPGRWAVEVLTREHRLYFKPMEKLAVQNRGAVQISEMEIDDKLDIEFKPGLYKQTKAFLSDEKDPRLLTIEKQVKHLEFYEKIEGVR